MRRLAFCHSSWSSGSDKDGSPASDRRFLGMTTTSMPAGKSSGERRKTSRKSRLARLRATALPNLRVAVIPSRAGSLSARGRSKRMQLGSITREPPSCTAKNSRRFRSRRDLGNDALCPLDVTTEKRLFLVGCYRQTPTTLAAAVGKHLRAASRLHAGAKTVLAPATGVVGLVGALHDRGAEVTTSLRARQASPGPLAASDQLYNRGVRKARRPRRPACTLGQVGSASTHSGAHAPISDPPRGLYPP